MSDLNEEAAKVADVDVGPTQEEIDYLKGKLDNARRLFAKMREEMRRKDEMIEELQRLRKRRYTKSMREKLREADGVPTELSPYLAPEIGFALANLHLIVDPDEPRTWAIDIKDAPSTSAWNMLIAAARNQREFSRKAMQEINDARRAEMRAERERERKQLEADLKLRHAIEVEKIKRQRDGNAGVDAHDVGMSELDDIET